jgi:hypothetical protein
MSFVLRYIHLWEDCRQSLAVHPVLVVDVCVVGVGSYPNIAEVTPPEKNPPIVDVFEISAVAAASQQTFAKVAATLAVDYPTMASTSWFQQERANTRIPLQILLQRQRKYLRRWDRKYMDYRRWWNVMKIQIAGPI